LGAFFFPETSEARILRKKAKKLSKETGQRHHTDYEGTKMTLSQELWTSIIRPTRLIATQPILQLMSVFTAFNFGVLYFVLSTFSSLFTDQYYQTTAQSGIHYLSLAIGYLIADQVGGIITDQIWAHLKKKAGDSTAPEFRVPLMVPGGLLMPIGLFWYGWSAEAKLHWIMPDIGAAVFGCGFMLNSNAMGAYVLDAFEKYTASATAASQALRMMAGFAFPIFAPVMYKQLGWGWGNSTLALISVDSGPWRH
jgi:MFS family permease